MQVADVDTHLAGGWRGTCGTSGGETAELGRADGSQGSLDYSGSLSLGS
jgi:hypothetical protein